MSSRGQTPPTIKARVVLQPLRTQKLDGSVLGKEEEEEKETKQETRPAPDTTRPIPDIKGQAGDIEKKLLAFCLGPSKKINKEQTATIMPRFKEMRGIVEELLLHNSNLTGKLDQCIGSVKETQILSAVNKSLQVSKWLETAVKKTARAEPKQPTYAKKIRMTNAKMGQLAIKPPRYVVIIRPEEEKGKIKTNEEAKEAVFTFVNPRKKGIQVTGNTQGRWRKRPSRGNDEP